MISLSNLLKYYRVMPAQPEHIIIDSNKRAEAILNPKTEEEEREEAERAKQEEEESARLTMEVAERVLEESKTRSMHIMEDANRKAEKIIQEANLHMAEVFDEQRQLGYQTGMRDSQEEINQYKKSLEDEYRRKEQMLLDDVDEQRQNMESQIIDALIPVFDKVLHVQFGDKKDILIYLIENTIKRAESSKNFVIHVSEEDFEEVRAQSDVLSEQLGQSATLEVMRDSSLQPMECKIETESGIFDCGLDTQLNGLLKDIRSLCV